MKDATIRELSLEEAQEVNGGIVPLIAIGGYYAVSSIGSRAAIGAASGAAHYALNQAFTGSSFSWGGLRTSVIGGAVGGAFGWGPISAGAFGGAGAGIASHGIGGIRRTFGRAMSRMFGRAQRHLCTSYYSCNQ